MPAVQCHHIGRCQLYVFMLSIIRSSKFIRSELMNTQGRGILSHLSEKISRLRFPTVAQLVFFPASAEHPSFPCVLVCQRANKLQTAIIRIKKISLYDTEQQTYQKYELHSFSSSYRIKKGGKSDRDNSRSDSLLRQSAKAISRGASLGGVETDLPRCGGIISILTALGIIYWITTL